MNTLPTLNRQGRSLIDNAMSGLGFARHPMVSRAGNRFTLIDGAGNSRPQTSMDQFGRIYMDVVIFGASPHPNRMYFAGAYEPDSNQPPDCFSDNGTGASTQARNPQAPTCAVCPQAKWGSKISPNGKEIPACQVGKKLAVEVIGDDSGLAYEFRVPPGSFSAQPDKDPQEGGWTWYLKTLRGYGKELFDVVTRITFVPNTMGVLVFKPVALVEGDAPLVERINLAWEKQKADELIGIADKPIDPASFQAGSRAPVQQVMPPPPAQQAGVNLGQQNVGFLQGVTATEPPKRTRRTKAQIEADNAAQAQAQANPNPNLNPFGQNQANPNPFTSGLQQAPQGAPVEPANDIPPFLRREQPGVLPFAQSATPPRQETSGASTSSAPLPSQGSNAQFGLATPGVPAPGIQAALEAAFRLPTGGK